MKAYLLFGQGNAHPWAWILDPRYRHVWCIIADPAADAWVSYDWYQGLPRVKVECALDYDIATHYRDQGWEIIDMKGFKREIAKGLYTLNNCVGHVKSVLGIGGFDWTPFHLYKRVTHQPRIWEWPWFTVPGFGGGGSTPAPPPPPVVAAAPQSDVAIAADKTLSEEAAARKKLQQKEAASASAASAGLLSADDDQTTLLS
jgi:hypothetical protein